MSPSSCLPTVFISESFLCHLFYLPVLCPRVCLSFVQPGRPASPVTCSRLLYLDAGSSQSVSRFHVSDFVTAYQSRCSEIKVCRDLCRSAGPDFVHAPPKVEGFPEAHPVCQLSTPQDASPSLNPPAATSAAAAAISNRPGLSANVQNGALGGTSSSDVAGVHSTSSPQAPVGVSATEGGVAAQHVTSNLAMSAEREGIGEDAVVLSHPPKLQQQHLQQTLPVEPG